MPLLLLLFSGGSLVLAYISQYGFGLEPCILCLYQRIPHFVVAGLAIIMMCLNRFFKLRMALMLLSSISLLTGAGIAFYHAGVEKGVFVMEQECGQTSEAEDMSYNELESFLLQSPHVPCDKPQFVFLGLSMAMWNMLFSAFIGILVFGTSIRVLRSSAFYSNHQLGD